MTFLAEQFEKLASDPSWPWELLKVGKTGATDRLVIRSAHFPRRNWYNACQIAAITATKATTRNNWIAQSPLDMARLALMVVEKQADQLASQNCISSRKDWNPTKKMTTREEVLDHATRWLEINPGHYTNVKKRVADTEGK